MFASVEPEGISGGLPSLIFLDLHTSYATEPAFSKKSLVDFAGVCRLDSHCWEIGARALEVLYEFYGDAGLGTPIGIANRFSELLQPIRQTLDSFYPELKSWVDGGLVELTAGSDQLNAAWLDRALPDRWAIFLQLSPALLATPDEKRGGFLAHLRSASALMVLLLLDEAMAEHPLGGMGLAWTIADLAKMAPYMEEPTNALAAVAVAGRAALSQRAARGGAKRHEATRRAKLWVQEKWNAEADSYGHNKSEFARVCVTLISNMFVDAQGDPLKVTDKQIRDEWLRTTGELAGR